MRTFNGNSVWGLMEGQISRAFYTVECRIYRNCPLGACWGPLAYALSHRPSGPLTLAQAQTFWHRPSDSDSQALRPSGPGFLAPALLPRPTGPGTSSDSLAQAI